jgi:ATP-binding cassette subfamily F protein 3
MSIISIQNLGLEFGARDIFTGIAVELPPGGKVGLVGPNGVGKTSLLRIVAGIAPPTTGTVHRRKDVSIGYLRQEAVEAFVGRHHTIWDEMLTVFTALRRQAARLQEMEARMAAGETDDALLAAYGAAQHDFEHAGGYEYEQNIRRVLEGLGFPADSWNTTVDHLSGGQKTRALLARLLLEQPTLLILDEPTNHLDVQAVEWLEKTLRTWEGSLIVCSHDRYFLDRVVDRIWEMTPHHIEVYRGNYSAYAQQRQERWERNNEIYERELERLRGDLETIRRYFAWRKFEEAHGRLKRLGRELMAIERHGILGIQGKSWGEMGIRSRSEMHLEEAHDRIKSLRNPMVRPPQIHLHLTAAGRSGQIIMRTHDLQVGYGRTPLFAADDIHLERLERVALIGPNGSGKTTFLRTILGQLEPVRGTVQLGASLKIGYFAQAHDSLDPNSTVLEELLKHRNLPLPEARNYLALYLFRGEDIDKPVRALSGGERGRLALAILTLEGVNFLLLDEPTNHLDIPAQEVLQEGLEQFNGTLLLVSHDRYLVDALATQIWELRDGRLHVFKGNYTEFVEARDHAGQPVAERVAIARSPSPATQTKASEKQERKRRQRLATVESQIAEAEATLARYTEEMARESASGEYDQVAELAESYTTLEAQLQSLMREWEQLEVESGKP